MEIRQVKVENIKPYPKNAKLHTRDQIEHVANSIKEFGYVQPIVIDKNNEIVIGHCRFEASKLLGMEEVPCLMVEDLTDDQVKALRLADNKTNESEWDDDLLNSELDILSDLDMERFGFDPIEDIGEEIESKDIKPEVEFTEVLGEENNYIILQFHNDIDWLQAETVFGIKPVKALSTRKDGKVTEKMQRIGTGRVLDGAEVLRKIMENKL